MGENIKKIKVDLTDEFLKKTIYWIICKFNMDEFKREQSSSKQALLGDFIDRWMNKAPEFLIFNELLKDKDYSAVNDSFFYTNSQSKNAPDILGLIDNNGKHYPFARFKDNSWEVVEGTPFIEMKTFRSTQSLVTIPYTQFDDDHYYAIVESHIEENYLLSIFEDELFENEEYYNSITSLNEEEFIISNNEGIIKKPDKLTKPTVLGYYYLLGIYKGSDLRDYSRILKQGDKPLYFFGEEEPPSRFMGTKVDKPILTNGIYHFDGDENNIPFDIKLFEGAELLIKQKISDALDVEVKGHVEIDGIKLKQGTRRLKFKKFEKSGGLTEIAMTKTILECYNEEISSIDELIFEFESIVE
ncbi:hypothetical protein IKE96_03920 [bacterium]|nr:hypothetical protein [bacterium]